MPGFPKIFNEKMNKPADKKKQKSDATYGTIAKAMSAATKTAMIPLPAAEEVRQLSKGFQTDVSAKFFITLFMKYLVYKCVLLFGIIMLYRLVGQAVALSSLERKI